VPFPFDFPVGEFMSLPLFAGGPGRRRNPSRPGSCPLLVLVPDKFLSGTFSGQGNDFSIQDW
jgi:hypothetical protein